MFFFHFCFEKKKKQEKEKQIGYNCILICVRLNGGRKQVFHLDNAMPCINRHLRIGEKTEILSYSSMFPLKRTPLRIDR